MKHPFPMSLIVSAVAMLSAPLGVAEELPAAVKAVEARGAEIVGSFDAPGGLRGYAARFNGICAVFCRHAYILNLLYVNLLAASLSGKLLICNGLTDDG